MKDFSNFFHFAWNSMQRSYKTFSSYKAWRQHFDARHFIRSYWYEALSEATMFRYLKEHSLAGLNYPNVHDVVRPDYLTTPVHYCRVCEDYSEWKVIGHKDDRDCIYAETEWGGIVNLADCYWMQAHGYTKSCIPQCTVKYFLPGDRQVNSLPGKAKSYGNGPALWRGDEWGYWRYGCVDTAQITFTELWEAHESCH